MNNNPINHTEEFQINEIIRPYITRLKWFVFSVILALLAAYFFLKTQNPVFETISTVLIKDSKRAMGGQDFEMLRDLSGLGKMNSDGVENEIEVFKSKKLMTSVIRDLGLETDIFISGFFRDTELYGATSPIVVKVINEKKTNKPVTPISLKIQGEQIILSSDELGTIKTEFNKVISLPNANIIILKNKNFVQIGRASCRERVYVLV